MLNLDEDAETMTKSFNAVMTDTENDLSRKGPLKFQPWVTDDILKLCDKQSNLKMVKNTRGAADYKEISKKIRSDMKRAKEEWIEKQCTEV